MRLEADDRASRRRRSMCRPIRCETQQPFLVDFDDARDTTLTPATAELKAALPDIVPAIEVGTTTLERTPSLNANLQRLMVALKNLAVAPGTNIALNGLVSTVTIAEPDDPLPRPVRDRVRLLELLVDLPGRAPLRADQPRLRPAARC